MRLSQTLSLVILGLGFSEDLAAQESVDTVQWTAAVTSVAGLRDGGEATLELSGSILPGWHVYALSEPDGGPTALRITLDDNDVVSAAGSPSSTPPQKKHDRSFGLVTEFYTHAFKVQVPVHVKSTAGKPLIPVNVRFQSCSDRECLPPRTIHLSVPVEAAS